MEQKERERETVRPQIEFKHNTNIPELSHIQFTVSSHIPFLFCWGGMNDGDSETCACLQVNSFNSVVGLAIDG